MPIINWRNRRANWVRIRETKSSLPRGKLGMYKKITSFWVFLLMIMCTFSLFFLHCAFFIFCYFCFLILLYEQLGLVDNASEFRSEGRLFVSSFVTVSLDKRIYSEMSLSTKLVYLSFFMVSILMEGTSNGIKFSRLKWNHEPQASRFSLSSLETFCGVISMACRGWWDSQGPPKVRSIIRTLS